MRQIDSCTIHLVEYDLKGYVLSYGTINKLQTVLLKMVDKEGVVGWGEANPQQPFTVESAQEVVDVLRNELLPTVLDQLDPEPGQVDNLLDAQRSDHLLAKGAITMALLDIKGKHLGVPAATVIGTPLHRSLPVLWPLSDQKVEDDVRIIDIKLDEGYSSFMLKMGQLPIPYEIQRVQLLEQRYGNKIKLIVDPNQGWNVSQAEEFLDGIKDVKNILFVEQPIDKCDLIGMANLAKRTNHPLSVDESLTGLGQAKEVIDKGAARVFSIKSSKNGGPLRARDISDLAQRSGVTIFMNSMLELGISQAASLQHGVTLPNLVDIGHAYMSTLRLDGDPTNCSTSVRNGVVYFSEAPGLGIEVDEEKVKAITAESHIVRQVCDQ